jgi:general stress protein YciG
MSCNHTHLAAARAGFSEERSVVLLIEGGIVAKRRRGFAIMEPGRQREIASKGGKAAHEKGTAHRWSGQEAKEAGRKGGAASHRNGHRTALRVPAADELSASETTHHESSGDDHAAEELPTEKPESNGVPS